MDPSHLNALLPAAPLHFIDTCDPSKSLVAWHHGRQLELAELPDLGFANRRIVVQPNKISPHTGVGANCKNRQFLNNWRDMPCRANYVEGMPRRLKHPQKQGAWQRCSQERNFLLRDLLEAEYVVDNYGNILLTLCEFPPTYLVLSTRLQLDFAAHLHSNRNFINDRFDQVVAAMSSGVAPAAPCRPAQTLVGPQGMTYDAATAMNFAEEFFGRLLKYDAPIAPAMPDPHRAQAAAMLAALESERSANALLRERITALEAELGVARKKLEAITGLAAS